MSERDVSREDPRPKGRWLAVAAAALVGLLLGAGAYAWQSQRASREPPPAVAAGRPDIGGPFQLVDQSGRPVDQGLLKGKWTAIFFGFTSCPDVCPATLQTLQAATERLGPAAGNLQVVFISVDPERDTPEALKSYTASFDFPGGMRALTGTPEQVRQAAKAWKAYYRKNGGGAGLHRRPLHLHIPDGPAGPLLSAAAPRPHAAADGGPDPGRHGRGAGPGLATVPAESR